MESDRRNYDRYMFNNDDFESLIDRSLKIYRVKDISEKGLSFQYYADEDGKLTENYINIKIIKGGKVEYEQELCPVIYDIHSIEEGQSLSGRSSRQCGVKFQKLSPLNKSYVLNKT